MTTAVVLVLCGRWTWLWWRWGLEEHTTQPILCRKSSPSVHPSLLSSVFPLIACTLHPSLHSNPLVSAITSIGYDHVAILGDTLAKIAWQKGGICKVSPHSHTYRVATVSWQSKSIYVYGTLTLPMHTHMPHTHTHTHMHTHHTHMHTRAHAHIQPGHPAFTVPQLAEPLKMLLERAKELKVVHNPIIKETFCYSQYFLSCVGLFLSRCS